MTMMDHRRGGSVPRILLAGLGRFGRQHLNTWRILEGEGLARLSGVLVRLVPDFEVGVPVFTDPAELDPACFDAVDIATPAASHHALVLRFLPHLHVLVEKPLAVTLQEAEEIEAAAAASPNVLMVNHLYRFHPSVQRLREFVAAMAPDRPGLVTVTMTNPVESELLDRQAALEFLHVFDIVDSIFGTSSCRCANAFQDGHAWQASLICDGALKVNVRFGWAGSDRVRTIEIQGKEKQFSADLMGNSIIVTWRGGFERQVVTDGVSTLEAAFRAFLANVAGRHSEIPRAALGRRIMQAALTIAPAVRTMRPQVGIIGAGLFGAGCALELSKDCDVTLIERHPGIMTEATYSNQWRHHSGFHYPRSNETVAEIQEARDTFTKTFGDRVILNIPSYYCTSFSAREITRERYLSACESSGLSYEISDPPPGVLDNQQVNLCLLTDEGVFDYHFLKNTIQDRILSSSSISVMLNASVTGARFGALQTKVLTIRGEDGRQQDVEFDYLVNATYANYGLLASYLGFPVEPLRFDLCEILVLELNLPPVAVTILDGPFTSLVGTGNPGEFLLSHIHESILGSDITADGLPPKWAPWRSNRSGLIRECSRYLPIIKDCRILESRYATRTVRAYADDYDGRPTVVTDYGFGCWSVLGGKLVTSAATARQLSLLIKKSSNMS